MSQHLRHLDGLRALSVALVFCFHAEVLGLSGGFIGVSVFFTLSGYLLSYRLLRVEPSWSSMRAYWQSRWRRILPAALTVIIAVGAVEAAAGIGRPDPVRTWLTAFGLSNWLQVASGSSYADLFASPDMLLHYWSLAIEEQVYLLLPLVLFASLRRSLQFARRAIVCLMTLSFALPLMLGLSTQRTYYGTDTRAGEILAGVALAIIHSQSRTAPPRWAVRVASGAGVTALVSLIAIATRSEPDSPFISAGLLPFTSLLTVTALHAARTDDGFAWGVLMRRPIEWIGRLSYPVYLVHWPILVLLDETRWNTATTAVVGALLSIVIAWPIERWIEQPIRYGTSRRTRPAAAATALVAILAVSLTTRAPDPAAEYLAQLDQRSNAVLRARSPSGTGSSGPKVPDSTNHDAGPGDAAAATPATLGVYGDSLAMTAELVLLEQSPQRALNLVAGSTKLGCGLVHSLEPAFCLEVPERWRRSMEAEPADVALVISCQWELVTRDLPGVGVRHVGQPEMDAMILEAYRDAADRLLSAGSRLVVWATCGEFSPVVGVPNEDVFRESRDPARVNALNALIRQVAAESNGEIVVLDIAPWINARRDDPAIRPDGSHFETRTPNPVAVVLLRMLRPFLVPVTDAEAQSTGRIDTAPR